MENTAKHGSTRDTNVLRGDDKKNTQKKRRAKGEKVRISDRRDKKAKRADCIDRNDCWGGEKHRVINQEPMIKSEEPAGKTPVTKGSRADPAR